MPKATCTCGTKCRLLLLPAQGKAMNPFSKTLLAAIIIVFAIWLLSFRNELASDNSLPAAEIWLANRTLIDEASVAEWRKYQLPREEPVSGLPDETVTHVRRHSFVSAWDVSAIIKEQASPAYPDGYYKWRQFDCAKGWYNRLNESGSWQRAVSSHRRGSAKYIQGADRREKLEFDDICAKYAK